MPTKQEEVRGESAMKRTCPLCGKEASQDPASTFTYRDHVHVFCCQACRDRFALTPDQFIVQLAHEYDQSLGYDCPLDTA